MNKKSIFFIIIVFSIIFSCSNKENKLYAERFINHTKEAGIVLSGDTLIFPKSAGFEKIKLPQFLSLREEKELFDTDSNSIKLQKLNYTDYSYELSFNKIKETGVVSVFPLFYMGAEFRGNKGELVIIPMTQMRENNKLVKEIGIGDSNIETEERKLFVTIILKDKSEIVFY